VVPRRSESRRSCDIDDFAELDANLTVNSAFAAAPVLPANPATSVKPADAKPAVKPVMTKPVAEKPVAKATEPAVHAKTGTPKKPKVIHRITKYS
jgi:hypothetical protein